ncbi:5-formyltetrahydrofolate cyclo-ligase [Amycolatopsis sp. PS_44_ISF1]|uniref:5-formyltetrahydrofolate cyclo-ligase n=1 Tax=Amycolatopsis sp. PS_44_ISF1 TaxID=2974917 RepID=UPI0028DD7CC6|nr:5-formyltetrahydrofolate cyclo-ligase [Amycolatopsis sp. PS_44_ISF1]MDT8911307.1 5-formyltetrahydrofolate cyclo-ligase [Amycolatopsis sp. PS_44_ISF1]
MRAPGNEHLSKAEWRTRVLRARASLSRSEHAEEAAALAASAVPVATPTVCAYLPFGTEPGTVSLLDALVKAGSRVLLPVVPDVPGPLDWAVYTGAGELVPGRLRGVREPAGPRLGVEAVTTAELTLVPALGVDRRGTRLGRGAGYYDRSLVFADPRSLLLAVVRASELVEQLPGQPHDVPMNGALTPAGVIRLPRCEAPDSVARDPDL